MTIRPLHDHVVVEPASAKKAVTKGGIILPDTATDKPMEGKVVAVGNLHLTSDPYGPDLLRDGATVEEALQGETDTRLAEITPYAAGMEPLIKAGTPVIVTGDFNSPSHLDYTEAAIGLRPAMIAAVPWPARPKGSARRFR